MPLYNPSGGQTEVTIKSADETINNSAVQQADDELHFSIGANEVVAAEYILFIDGSNAADLKFSFTVPALCTWYMSTSGRDAAGNDVFDVDETAGDMTVQAVGATKPHNTARATVIFINGANSGTVSLTWAQAVANASDMTVKAGSLMKLWRVY